MLNNTSGSPAGTLDPQAPQPNAAAPNFPAPNFAAPVAVAPQPPVPAGSRPVHGAPNPQVTSNLPPRPLAIKIVFIFMIVFLSTYPLQPLVGLEFTFTYMLAGMTGGLTMIFPIVFGAFAAGRLNDGYQWARVVIIIEGALRMLLDIVFVALFSHVLLDNDNQSAMYKVMFFGPFMSFEVLYAKLAFDFISRILIIVLLCQPQVGRYIQMRGDLRRMGVR